MRKDTVYLWSDMEDPGLCFHESDITWLTGVLPGRSMLSPFGPLPLRDESPHDSLFGFRLIVDPAFPPSPVEEDATAAFFYPEMRSAEARTTSPLHRFNYLYYRLPAVAVIGRRGLDGRYASSIRSSDEHPDYQRTDLMDGRPIPNSSPSGSVLRDLHGLWSGWVYISTPGPYRFEVRGDGRPTLRIDGATTADSTTRSLELGWHAVQIRADHVRFDQPPALLAALPGEEPAAFAPRDLHATWPLRGVVRTWVLRCNGREKTYLRRIEPAILPLQAAPFLRQLAAECPTAEFLRERWEGWLKMPQASHVQWALQSRLGVARLSIDGMPVLTVPRPDHPGWPLDHVSADLPAGTHHLEVVFESDLRGGDVAGVTLAWARNDSPWGIVPPEYLSPIPPDAVLHLH